ncbi:hypothetical protein N7495_000505 [Penicillium taxi]|uniref:uncharacterized protein n=1 Tax=Penicillium taxi TaxID=168475 RepID=UPI0025452F86|nr:uncharacterized protein N7495_000505 [Penicillium taxi]KAJ5907823.1 hypothetical protein N7495_000505 [Penicillium taxi]
MDAVFTNAKQWNIAEENGVLSLRYSEKPIPQLDDNQVLVKIHGTSLNFRDLLISQEKYTFDLKPGVFPGSDGAGTVVAIVKHVTRFQPGDHVVTIIQQQHLAGSIDARTAKSGLGGSIDGTLRPIGAFDEQWLVAMPQGLSFVEASTLSLGQCVITQGTGGVSLFAVQFAKSVGARVIATTSTREKAKFLENLGADHIGGPSTLEQSIASLKLDGLLCVVESVGSAGQDIKMPHLLDCWVNLFTARGIWVGSRLQMEEMIRAIEANIDTLRPVVDSVFPLDQVKEAYSYLACEHLGKVCINIE